MSPVLLDGNKILVYKFAYLLKPPQINDVVVIKNPKKDKTRVYILKRISKIKDKQIYVEGDNKNVSYDSRHYGWINREMILGKMIRKL